MGGVCRGRCVDVLLFMEAGRFEGMFFVKQKESSGAVTVPGRNQDNCECNGVLNGKSSVFSHRFNVIAFLHCYALLFRSMLPPSIECFYSCILGYPNFLFTSAHPKSNTLLFFVIQNQLQISLLRQTIKQLCLLPDHHLCRALTHVLCIATVRSIRFHFVSFCEMLKASLSRRSPLLP